MLPEADQINLAVRALAGTATITDPAAGHVVSRKFAYQQANKARAGLAEVFASSARDEVLFELSVTKTWLRQLTLGLPLICHSSYCGVVELMRDLLGVTISEATVHNVHQATARQAGAINRSAGLSPIRAVCTTKYSRVPSPCSPVSTPGRATAICLPRSNIAMPTPGAYICSTLRCKV
jgi:hypothetical protein